MAWDTVTAAAYLTEVVCEAVIVVNDHYWSLGCHAGWCAPGHVLGMMANCGKVQERRRGD